ncbi:hypothetical protein M8C21_032695 [Ambrosia artemisiifolia]|uniref:Glycerol-3-phosphate acyltransferase, chloroplastic n=1 Tax=Ambrosia artemisiifolia TaxID=4212 RepID=A0AAD5CLI3_AMBAR|nr:hypothetical protein M8C21_032695 [Ambrosia artemisiifolia]
MSMSSNYYYYSSSSCPTLVFSTTNPRVSLSLSPTSSSTYSSLRTRSIIRRFPYLAFSRAANAAAETFEDKKWSSSSSTRSISGSELGYSHTFIDALSEQDLLSVIQRELEAGTLPKHVAHSMEELYQNYKNAVFQSGNPLAEDIVLSNMRVAFDRMYLDVKEPFEFSPYHEAIREPFNYYMFGQNYIRPLINFRESYVGNVSLFSEMEEQLKQLLNSRGGSKIIWIAPSGGRDRPDPVTNQWFPAPFDATSLDNMRRLVDHAGVVGHIYPLAILCHDIMPPPPQVEKEIGEKRLISFHGTGISVAPEVNFQKATASCGSPEEAKAAYSQTLYDSVYEQYNVLQSAINGGKGLEASTSSVSLSQPLQPVD